MTSEKSELRKVRDFMEANGQNIRFTPIESLPEWEKTLRVSLLIEEVQELGQALGVQFTASPLVCKNREVNPVAALDALTDIFYVLLGTYHTLGLSGCAREAFEEVHQSNMSKLGPDMRPVLNTEGKVMKGPNYLPPNLAAIVAATQQRPVIFDDSGE